MTLFIISLVSLGAFAQYGNPSTSGPGITVLSGSQSFRTANFGGDNMVLCEDNSGQWWKPGSRIQNTNINQIATCESSGQWSYVPTCTMSNRQYCWTNCAHNFSPDCQSACQCQGATLGSSRTATRLGAAGLPTADQTQSTQKMGGGWSNQCPTYAPYNGDYCSTSGLFCQYPNLNQNYICKSGSWSLQTSPTKKSCTKWGQTFKDGYQYLGQYGCYEWSCRDGTIVYNPGCGPYKTTTIAPITTTSPKQCWVWKGWYWAYDWSCWTSPWSPWTNSN